MLLAIFLVSRRWEVLLQPIYLFIVFEAHSEMTGKVLLLPWQVLCFCQRQYSILLRMQAHQFIMVTWKRFGRHATAYPTILVRKWIILLQSRPSLFGSVLLSRIDKSRLRTRHTILAGPDGLLLLTFYYGIKTYQIMRPFSRLALFALIRLQNPVYLDSGVRILLAASIPFQP